MFESIKAQDGCTECGIFEISLKNQDRINGSLLNSNASDESSIYANDFRLHLGKISNIRKIKV